MWRYGNVWEIMEELDENITLPNYHSQTEILCQIQETPSKNYSKNNQTSQDKEDDDIGKSPVGDDELRLSQDKLLNNTLKKENVCKSGVALQPEMNYEVTNKINNGIMEMEVLKTDFIPRLGEHMKMKMVFHQKALPIQRM